MNSGRPRGGWGPGKPSKRYAFLVVFPGPRGRPALKNAPNKSGQTAFRHSEIQNEEAWVPEGNLAGFLGAFLKSGRLRGLGKAFEHVGGFAPHRFEGFPGPPGPARPQKRTPKNPARLPSGQILVLADFGSVLGKSWARDRYERPRLAKRCIDQRKLIRETDSKAPKLTCKIRP